MKKRMIDRQGEIERGIKSKRSKIERVKKRNVERETDRQTDRQTDRGGKEREPRAEREPARYK